MQRDKKNRIHNVLFTEVPQTLHSSQVCMGNGYGYLQKHSRLMPYPCSQFCADIEFDNRFGIKVGDSFHVIHTINFVGKYMIYGIV